MVDEGYVTRDGSLLSLTEAGVREAGAITAAWAGWLEERVARDIGHPAPSDLRAAVDAISKRLLAEDLGDEALRRRAEPEAAVVAP